MDHQLAHFAQEGTSLNKQPGAWMASLLSLALVGASSSNAAQRPGQSVPEPTVVTRAPDSYVLIEADSYPALVLGKPTPGMCPADKMLLCSAAPACTLDRQAPPPLSADVVRTLDKLTATKNRWGTRENPIDKSRLAALVRLKEYVNHMMAGACFLPDPNRSTGQVVTTISVP